MVHDDGDCAAANRYDNSCFNRNIDVDVFGVVVDEDNDGVSDIGMSLTQVNVKHVYISFNLNIICHSYLKYSTD